MTKLGVFLSVIFGAAAVSGAAPATFEFDPNSLMDDTAVAVGLRAEQAAPRLIVGNRSTLTGIARSFYTAAPGDTNQPNELNAYNNWRDGLNSAGEGITGFNLWITTAGTANNPHDGGSSATWNQTLYRDGSNGNGAAGISATAAPGWNAQVLQVTSDSYGVLWYTNDAALSLRPTSLGGADLSNFSFSMTDTNAIVGNDYRVWVGASAGGSNADSVGLTFDANGWGNRATNIGPFASVLGPTPISEGSVWQGVISVAAVPEPTSMGMLAIAAVGALRRRR